MGDYEDNGMSETSVSEEGALSQIGSSFKNVLVGIVCFIAAWPVLYCGASRVQWQKVFKKAVPIEQAKEGNAAYLTGVPVATQIGDANVPMGNYLKISSTPEVYAWVEHSKSESKTERKGVTRKKVTKTKTTYSYTLEWTSSPRPISEFKSKFWQRHARNSGINPNVKNPVMTKKSTSIYSPNCTVNGYKVVVQEVNFYGGSKSMGAKYTKGTAGAPRLGDERINYVVQPSDISYTFAGTPGPGKTIVPYDEGDKSMLAANPGNFKSLLKAFESSDNMQFWMWFLGGFILMAAGLNMMVGPVTALLDFIPFVGELGASVIRVVLTIVALILSGIFYVMVKYWIILVILLLAGVVGLIVMKKMKKQPAAA